MAASKIKLAIKQGATFRQRLTWKTGTPATLVNLTGWTARMQLRADITDPVVLLTLDTENGGIVLGGAAGTIDLYIGHVATAGFTWESAVLDLEMVAPGPDGDVIRLVEGVATNSFEVTRV
jgi:hypothetical protein